MIMRKNFGPQSWLFPMPVLLVGTYDENGNANIMNAAWGGIYDTNKIAVCIDPGHKTAKNLQLRKAFTVSIGNLPNTTACDYVGIVSGNKEPDKTARAGFHPEKSAFTDAPLFRELPMTLECELLSFDSETGCSTGLILNVSADESILSPDGKISADLLMPISFDPVTHTYRKLGEVVGKAFEDGKKLF